jgi:hypothetical protein
MKNINMRRLILEQTTSLEPKDTDKFPIKPYGNGQYEFGLRDNLLVYRRKGDEFEGGKFGEWLNYSLVQGDKTMSELKSELYGIKDQESADAAYERQRAEKNSKTNVKTNEKCLPLKTPPAGLTLNIKNPGDKNYIYGKVGEEWFAQNVKNKKIFNLTKCNYTTSITKLEKLKTGSANASVEQLQNQSKEIQQSAGLPETGSFDIQSLERLIKLLSDEEQPKVQSVQDLIPNAKIQTPNAEEQLKQIASQQTIRQ